MTEQNEQEEKRIKIVVIGDGAIGKTSLLVRYERNEFPEDYDPTVFDNFNAVTQWERQKVILRLWDTAGQEDYDRLRSFDNIPSRWIPELQQYCPQVPIILVGCKLDMRDDKKISHAEEIVTTEMGQKMMETVGAVGYMECSAKTGKNVIEVFDLCVKHIMSPKVVVEEVKKGRTCIMQ